jgi:cytochrome c556
MLSTAIEGPNVSKQISLVLLLVMMTGCNATKPAAPTPAATPIKAIATREEIMHHLVIPNAQAVWNASGTIYTAKGVEERAPKNADEWFNVESSATTLMEAGNLLMMDGRAMDNGKWIEYAKALRDSGDLVRQAAKAKDVNALFERGGTLFDSCQACHFEYRFDKNSKMMRTH